MEHGDCTKRIGNVICGKPAIRSFELPEAQTPTLRYSSFCDEHAIDFIAYCELFPDTIVVEIREWPYPQEIERLRAKLQQAEDNFAEARRHADRLAIECKEGLCPQGRRANELSKIVDRQFKRNILESK